MHSAQKTVLKAVLNFGGTSIAQTAYALYVTSSKIENALYAFVWSLFVLYSSFKGAMYGFISLHNRLFTEFCAGGSLQLIYNTDGHLPEDVVKDFGWKIASGLQCVWNVFITASSACFRFLLILIFWYFRFVLFPTTVFFMALFSFWGCPIKTSGRHRNNTEEFGQGMKGFQRANSFKLHEKKQSFPQNMSPLRPGFLGLGGWEPSPIY